MNNVSSRAYIGVLAKIVKGTDTVAVLERNLIPLHRRRVIVKLLTSQPILQTIHPLTLTLFLHLILA